MAWFIAAKAMRERVGLVGFEPTASASRTQRSTKLSHSPNCSFFRGADSTRTYLAHFSGSSKRNGEEVIARGKREEDLAIADGLDHAVSSAGGGGKDARPP